MQGEVLGEHSLAECELDLEVRTEAKRKWPLLGETSKGHFRCLQIQIPKPQTGCSQSLHW